MTSATPPAAPVFKKSRRFTTEAFVIGHLVRYCGNCGSRWLKRRTSPSPPAWTPRGGRLCGYAGRRSEEHTSELQSHHDLVCRLLLEKKKKKTITSKIAIYV